MLLDFFYLLRAYKIKVGVNEWLSLMDALSQNLADSSLERFYYLARSVLVKSEALYDAYDQAFLAATQNLAAHVDLKEELMDWLNKNLEGKTRPALPQIDPLTLEELKKRFLERIAEQKEEHHGGSKWIGTGGTSPFGHGGAHPSGIRIGGPGGGRMAVKVAEERRFKAYRQDLILDTRQMKVALKGLRKLKSDGYAIELNLEKSIQETCKNAGEIDLVFEAPRKNQVELLLLMDVGGSMDMYAQLAESLFSAAHSLNHFKAFQSYYFHNCIYSKVYEDASQRKSISLDQLFKKTRKTFYLMIVGDACMNPYELFSPGGIINYYDDEREAGITWLKRLKNHFPQSVWLNPEPKNYWQQHPTIKTISQVFSMHDLSVKGLTEAVDEMMKI